MKKKLNILVSFFNGLKSLKREKSFTSEIFGRLSLLERMQGFIPNQTKKIKAYEPLMELVYKDVRIFYMIKSSEILVVGILKKDVNRFSAKVLENLRKKGN